MRAIRTARGRALAAAAALCCTAKAASGEASVEALADPTRPPLVSAAPAEAPAPVDVQWRLAMVRVSGGSRSAVLNGTLVHEGDTVDGYRVERIAAGTVTLASAGRRTVVAIADGSLKRPSGTPRRSTAPPALKQSAGTPLTGNAPAGEEPGARVKAGGASAAGAARPEPEATKRTGK